MSDLKVYLPDYYDDVTEANAIMDAENPEFDDMEVAMLHVQNNQFVLTADSGRIRQWEKLLRIRPDLANQGLDYRKAVVIMRLSTSLPLNYSWLEDKLIEIVGSGHFVITMDSDNYWLHIRLTNDMLGLVDELRFYLREKIPANLGLTLTELFKTWGEVLDTDYLTWGGVIARRDWGQQRCANLAGYVFRLMARCSGRQFVAEYQKL